MGNIKIYFLFLIYNGKRRKETKKIKAGYSSNSFRNSCMAIFGDEPKPDMSFIDYIVWGKEICPKTKKEHFQCYVEFKDKYTIKKCQKYLGVDNTCHLESRKGSPLEASIYCKKDATEENPYKEIGILPVLHQGKKMI